MKFTNEMLERIEKVYTINCRKIPYTYGFGISVKNSSLKDTARVYINDVGICDVTDLQQMIDELNVMRKTIQDLTGIC